MTITARGECATYYEITAMVWWYVVNVGSGDSGSGGGVLVVVVVQGSNSN